MGWMMRGYAEWMDAFLCRHCAGVLAISLVFCGGGDGDIALITFLVASLHMKIGMRQ